MAQNNVCDCTVIHEDAVYDARLGMRPKKLCLELAELLKMFADGTRIRILHALEQRELCVCDLAVLLETSKSNISHQLRSLRMAKLVKCRREGHMVFYSLADEHVRSILDIGFEHIQE